MRIHLLITLVFLISPILALANDPDGNDSFAYEPQTGTYIHTYTFSGENPDAVPSTVRTRYIPKTWIVPSVKSKVAITTGEAFRYSYGLKNGSASKQRLSSILFIGSHADRFGVSTPAGWMEVIVPDNISPTQAPNAATQYRISWSYVGGGIAPGSYQDGFAFVSNDLPGIASAQLRGHVVPFTKTKPDTLVSDAWVWPPNNAASRQAAAFDATDYLTRFVAAPKIKNPVPFSAAVVLTNLQTHLKTDVVPLGLIDPVLMAVIDRGLTQAIAATQSGNTPSLLHEIKSLRQLLKQEHADVDQDNDGDDDDKQPKPRIAKLAAKVLDFDLKYVEKRVKGDKD